MLPSIFTVTKEQVGALGPEEAVDVLRRLLWAEANVLGISKTLIDVPSKINWNDGGLDAEVDSSPKASNAGIIHKGFTAYQVKSGDFRLTASSARDILFDKAPRAKGARNPAYVLKPRVKTCLDRQGTLIVALFGWDGADSVDAKTEKLFRDALQKYAGKKYPRAAIKIWKQNKLLGLLERFPALCLAIKGGDPLKFQSHGSWAQNWDMGQNFETAPDFKTCKATVQDLLRKSDGAQHVRIIEDAGVGKTRFVLEATRQEDIAPLVIYTIASSSGPDDLVNYLCQQDNQAHAILVVDECDAVRRDRLWNVLANRGARIKLVTIFNESEPTQPSVIYPQVPLLSTVEIKAILKRYGVEDSQLDRWAEFVGGSPRLAHMIGLNLQRNPDDALKDVRRAYDRILAGYSEIDSDDVKRRKTILTYVALFRRFGYGGDFIKEAKAIHALIQSDHSDISWGVFQDVIRKARELRILQGDRTLYISPLALHVHLWNEWWEARGEHFSYYTLKEKLQDTPELLKWFHEMFRYAKESGSSSQIVKELLGPGGPFSSPDFLDSDSGSSFFLALTEASPQEGLSCLERLDGTAGTGLAGMVHARRNIVWSLERIVIWRALFTPGARILLKLAEAETETYGNNATGIFTSLFSPGFGAVAPTEAPPAERFPVLEEAIKSSSEMVRRIALKACDEALEAHHFSRSVGAEFQGLKRPPKLWQPTAWGELYDYYGRVWNLLLDSLPRLLSEERAEAVSIILRRSRGLLRIGNLTEMVLDALRTLARDTNTDRTLVIAAIVRMLKFEGKGMPSNVRSSLEDIQRSMVDESFASRLQRYVGMHLWEDYTEVNGQYQDTSLQKIGVLAQESVADPSKLLPELQWLVTDAAQNGAMFGHRLAKEDSGFRLLNEITQAQRRSTSTKPSATFLSGYLSVVFEMNRPLWEKTLDEFISDPLLCPLIPEVTWRSGLSENAAKRLLALTPNPFPALKAFQYFGMGMAVLTVPEEIFIAWIDKLLAETVYGSACLAVELVEKFYCSKDAQHTLPAELGLRAITNPILVQPADRRIQLDSYHWALVAQKLMELYPEKQALIAKFILQHFHADGTMFDSYSSEANSLLFSIMAKKPREVWQIITELIGPPIDSRAFAIRHWLCGHDDFFGEKKGVAPLSYVPPADIFSWVDQAPEKRAWYLASFVPKQLSPASTETKSLARLVLERYGDRKDVRNNLNANFFTEGYIGPASVHQQKKKEEYSKLLAIETNENVRRWLREFIASIDGMIDRARAEEERGR